MNRELLRFLIALSDELEGGVSADRGHELADRCREFVFRPQPAQAIPARRPLAWLHEKAA